MLKMGCAAVEFGLTDCLNIHKFAKPIEQVPKFLKTSSPCPPPSSFYIENVHYHNHFIFWKFWYENFWEILISKLLAKFTLEQPENTNLI
jgi:hypothetical protein